nr:bifunctional 4-hydroxy-2-oxoglutarate aldolase/2-dehydro-3-deoxy-phosphogluconate aldolase [uncultured Caproiciproducens sp.]
MENIFEKLHKIGIIPVVKINNAKQAVELAKALSRGGLPAAEITFRSDAAAESISEITKNGLDFMVCAGTVLNIENAKRAVEAGAQAIISPGTNPEVVSWCLANHVTVIPGCATPSEIERCMRMGLKVVKLFPAEVVGGVKMLKALSGPYAGIQFMPTGGINASNVSEYLKLPNVVACGGSWMVPEKLLDQGDFAQIEKLSSEATAGLNRQ